MNKLLCANKSFLISLFIFSFLVRAIIFVGYLSKNQNYWQVDSNTYHILATQIAANKGLSMPDGINGDKPCFYRLPGYSLFLAAYYKIFGTDTKNALWLQILIAALIPILIFLLSLSLFPSNLILAKASAIYSSIHLGLVLYSGFFMTETLFIFLFLIFLFLFLSSVHLYFCPRQTSFNELSDHEKEIPFYFFALPEPIASNESHMLLFEDMFGQEMQDVAEVCVAKYTQSTTPILFCSGLALGLTSLVRPVGHYLLVLAILLILVSNCMLQIKIRKIFFTIFGWIIPVSFLLARNYMLTGAIFFHTLPGGHFLYLSAARVAMHTHNCSYEQARNILKNKVELLIKQEEQIKNKRLSDIEKCRVHEKLAIKYFKSMPIITIKNWLTDMLRTSLSPFMAEILYLESDRQAIDYFNKDRTISSMFKKYIWPSKDNIWLNFLVWLELILFLFILIGFFCGITKITIQAIKNWSNSNKQQLCAWLISIPFIALFITISLAGGYARMRLPIEPFLIILSLSFWTNLLHTTETGK